MSQLPKPQVDQLKAFIALLASKPDTDEPQVMGDCESDEPAELTEEQMDEFNEKRSEAMAALSEADWPKAVDLFTEAIKINSSSAAVYAKRGTCYLKMKRPNACIRDCDRAVKLNPDSAAAHKFRGRAHRLVNENYKRKCVRAVQ